VKIAKFMMVIFFIMAMCCQYADSEIIFQENFDGFTSGWTPSDTNTGQHVYPCINGECAPLGNYEPSIYPPEERTNENSWNGWATFGASIISIETGVGRNGTPCLRLGPDWPSAMSNQNGLCKWLGKDGYRELYIRWYWKFDKGWKWSPGTPPNYSDRFAFIKLLRIWTGVNLMDLGGALISDESHFNHPIIPRWVDDRFGSFEPFLSVWTFEGQDSQTCYSNGKCTVKHWYRDPDDRKAYLSEYTGPLANDGSFQNEQTWHYTQFHIRLNSSHGAGDSLLEAWIDGVKLDEPPSNFPNTGEPVTSMEAGGINYIIFGENMAMTREWTQQHYYYIDDITVSTTPIGTTGDAYKAPGNLRIVSQGQESSPVIDEPVINEPVITD